MKSLVLTFAILATGVSGLSAQENAVPAPSPALPQYQITVFDGVLKVAEWATFPYKDKLANATACDLKSIDAFLQFSGTVDGRDALNHAVTCLELIQHASDDCMAMSISNQKTKLKSVLLERLTLAQGRTKVEALRRPLEEWAPLTWLALNNKPFPADMQPNVFGCMKDKSHSKPGNDTSPAAVPPGNDSGSRN